MRAVLEIEWGPHYIVVLGGQPSFTSGCRVRGDVDSILWGGEYVFMCSMCSCAGVLSLAFRFTAPFHLPIIPKDLLPRPNVSLLQGFLRDFSIKLKTSIFSFPPCTTLYHHYTELPTKYKSRWTDEATTVFNILLYKNWKLKLLKLFN